MTKAPAIEAVFRTGDEPKIFMQQSPAQPQGVRQQASTQRDIPTDIWEKFQPEGVLAGVTASNPRLQQMSDLRTATAALSAGHSPKDVEQAIAAHSLYLKQASVEAQDYAHSVLQQAQLNARKQAPEKSAEPQRAISRHPSRKTAQQRQRQKVKSRDQGMGY